MVVRAFGNEEEAPSYDKMKVPSSPGGGGSTESAGSSGNPFLHWYKQLKQPRTPARNLSRTHIYPGSRETAGKTDCGDLEEQEQLS